MESRHIKDFAIAVAVIILFAFIIKAVNVANSAEEVPAESIYRDMALDQQLLGQIQQIEHSIRDRMDFIFTVTRDPLEQNLVVRTRVDLEEEWRKKVESMMRLAATYIDEEGNKMAAVAYQGKTRVYGVGDYIEDNRITDIDHGRLTLVHNGQTTELELKPIPPKPAQIDSRSRTGTQEYIW